MIKQAFILAAGLGTRLGKQTEHKPKALVEVNGKPMLQLVIESLLNKGINEFIINIHHFGQQILDFLEQHQNFGATIYISDERNLLLDTGGAIAKSKAYLSINNPILIHNVDVVADPDLQKLEDYHSKKTALATLCIRQRPSNRYLLFDDKMNLVGWENVPTKEFRWVDKVVNNFQAFAYSGIYLADPEFVCNLPFRGKFSIIDAWLTMASSHNIIGYHDKSPVWFDLGTEEKIKEAKNYLKGGQLG
jgi:NDP-sugar pyrophosphorylase family protein